MCPLPCKWCIYFPVSTTLLLLVYACPNERQARQIEQETYYKDIYVYRSVRWFRDILYFFSSFLLLLFSYMSLCCRTRVQPVKPQCFIPRPLGGNLALNPFGYRGQSTCIVTVLFDMDLLGELTLQFFFIAHCESLALNEGLATYFLENSEAFYVQKEIFLFLNF